MVIKRAGTSSGIADTCMLDDAHTGMTGGGTDRSLTIVVGFWGYGGGSLRGMTGASSGRISGPRKPVVS